MLAFFRKIRWRLAENNQFFKYSRYAIGEIVLVVIGILIALYINNWNQQRINKSQLIDRLILVEKELLTNVGVEVEWHIEDRREHDSILRGILNGRYTKEDYKYMYDLRQVLLEYVGPKFNTNAYNNFQKHVGLRDPKLDSIEKNLNRLYTVSQVDIQELSDKLKRMSIEFEDELSKTKSWYFDFFEKKSDEDEAINYFFEDPNYKNKVYLYFKKSRFYISMLLLYRNRAQMIHRELQDYINETRPSYKVSSMFSYDPQKYLHYLGTYKDSVTTAKLFIAKDKLLYSYQIGEQSDTAEIIPVNRRYFNTSWGDGFHYLVFDKNGNVEALQWKFNVKAEEYRKIE